MAKLEGWRAQLANRPVGTSGRGGSMGVIRGAGGPAKYGMSGQKGKSGSVPKSVQKAAGKGAAKAVGKGTSGPGGRGKGGTSINKSGMARNALTRGSWGKRGVGAKGGGKGRSGYGGGGGGGQ